MPYYKKSQIFKEKKTNKKDLKIITYQKLLKNQIFVVF